MARAIKVAGSTKKPKKATVSVASIRENRNKDLSPNWTNVDGMTASEYRIHHHYAMQYYNIQFSGKDMKPAVLKWMEQNNYEPSIIKAFKSSKDWRCSTTMGAVANCLLKGMPEQRDDFNNGKNTREWLDQAILNVIDDGRSDIEEDDEIPAKPNNVVNIQERMKETAGRMTEDIEEYLDNWISSPNTFDPKQIKVLAILKSKEAKAGHARIIKEYYANGMAEISEAIAGTDEQLKEGYSNKSKKHLNNLLTFFKEIDSACSMLMEEAKVTRKPRAKKAVSKDKLVEKLKFLKTFEPLKLVSVNPTELLNSKEVWTFNTKTRKLGKYIADPLQGPITVKGSSLVGYDEHNSIQKTIRNPEQKLKEFKAAGKIELRKFLDNINATDTKMTGRINEDIILLKVS